MIAALETRAATVIVGRKTILAPLSLQFAQGETVALVGPNGAGKSTLLRLLAGELAPSSGWVGLRGTALADYSPQRLAQHRAMLSQSVAVAFPFTVAEVVAMGAGAAGTSGIEHLVAEALAEVDLADFGSRIVTTLSGGEQQRAHFARVLVQSRCGEALYGPGVLLLDEPTASLDLKHQLALATIARKRAAAGTTVVAVLHDLNLACLFADRIVVLDRGRVAADGPPRAVMTEALLADVFGVCGALGCVPADRPFVLPHGAAALPCGGAATSPNQMSPNQ
ncbi:MAG TPA: heme ABC transporter ATP-binding protein [Xanthobacteraceae bacterium]|nr:heme ABC transporter ATP-binding protein [Xanthobacteraceae bacterium]